MAKIRTRRLWLNVKYDIPQDVSEQKIIATLIRSIKRGDYRIPRNWRVAIEWRNKESAPMRKGEWRAELEASAESSPGFERAVIHYLEGKQ